MSRALHSKIRGATALARTLAQARRKGRRVVFTNGCFDLLHKGHVSYLERARKLGDLLVVALNDDGSVRRLKGAGRPLNPLEDRLEVIAALESVDFTTWFSEDIPLNVILKLKPDVLVKGGDWTAKTTVGVKEVRSWGGKFRAIPYIKGRSTTELIARAKTGKSASRLR